MKGNHNSDFLFMPLVKVVFNMSKIQNERKSQLNMIWSYTLIVVFNMSKIQNERKSQHKYTKYIYAMSCVQHVKDTK